ncbi:serpin family protein [Dyella sp. M7H15-1]|uniref:serpin family protein n=1 Tax=Dyella sp. M7H15-1 TaxID=2501295 RepID=UPI0013E8A987|nr:serpin family protein [Dyella sp. M7H15-1]
MRMQTMVLAFLFSLSWPLWTEAAMPSDASLGFALLKKVSAEHPDSNVIIAPRNIRTALAAVATGAEGQTEEQIVALTGEYKDIDNTSLGSAQSAMDIWVAPVEKLLPAFAAGLPGVHVQSTRPQAAPAAINGFVSAHTHGMITHVLDQVPNTGIVLTAVLYFKGIWQKPFDKNNTKPRPFHVTRDKTADVDTMFQASEFDYAENDSGQIIQLPYSGDDHLVMTVFLPKPEASVQSWLTTIDEISWKAMLGALHRQSGSLQIPKLKSTFSTTLGDELKALGVRRAFANDAQFNGIVEGRNLQISEILHKTAFAMDEVSTEASAATSIILRAAAMRRPQPPFSMIVDRPFFLTIGDRSNDRILFVGVVNAP